MLLPIICKEKILTTSQLRDFPIFLPYTLSVEKGVEGRMYHMSEAYSEPSQASKMERFAKMIFMLLLDRCGTSVMELFKENS